MANTLYDRIGAAIEVGAPLGAAVDMAKASTSTQQVTAASRAVAPAMAQAPGASFFRPQAAPSPLTVRNPAEGVLEATPAAPALTRQEFAPSGESLGSRVVDALGTAAGAVGRAAIHALEWGYTATSNYVEANFRTIRNEALDGNWAGAAWNAFRGPSILYTTADPEWREEWEKSVDARATLFQTLWAGVAELTDESAAPFETMIDDPEHYGERLDYFSSGTPMWVTGVGDALWSVFGDPLVFAGKIGGVVKAGRGALKAKDVSKVAAARRGEIAEEALTGKQRTFSNLVHEFAAGFERDAAGQVASAAQTKWLKNTRDGGAIAYMMRRAGDGIDDAAGRIAAREEVLLAGMGDAQALARLGERNGKLAVELRRLNGEIDEMRALGEWSKAGWDDDAIRRMYDVLDDAPLTIAEKKALAADVTREMDALARVQKVGAPLGSDLPGAVGDLANIPVGWAGRGGVMSVRGAAQRDLVRASKTYLGGRMMTPVTILQGRHLSGVFRLADETDAVPVFLEANRRARKVAAKIKDPTVRAEYQTRFAQMMDEFVAAGNGAASKGPRGRVMDQFNATVDEVIAARHGINPEQLTAVTSRIRKLRNAEIREVGKRLYKARQARAAGDDTPAMVRTEEEILAVTDDAPWVEMVGGPAAQEAAGGARPVLASQVEDWASIVDPRRLDYYAGSTFREGTAGYLQRGADGAWAVTEYALTKFNRVWKFGALLRPFAYFVRNQFDTQMRLAAKMKTMEYLAGAVRGAGNKAYNLKKIDVATRDLLLRRLDLTERVDALRTQFVAAQGNDVLRAELKSELQKATTALERLPKAAKPSGKKVRIGDTELARRVGLRRGIDVRTGKVTKADPLDPYQSYDEWKRTYQSLDSEDAVMGVLTDQTSRAQDAMRRSGNWDVLYGHEPGWEEAYLRAVNFQVRSDAMGKMILEGADEATVVRWLRETPEGRAYFNNLHSASHEDALGMVQEAIEHIDTLLPAGSEVRTVAIARDLTPGDAQKAWELPAHRPGVNGERLTELNKSPLERAYGTLERKYFNWAASIPEGMMGRHPFYAGRFGEHARRLLDEVGVADAKTLTPKQLSAVRRRADQLARRDVAEYLFDTSRKSNASHAMRFLSPFYAAWEDSMFKWYKIFGTNPESLPLAWKGVRSPNAAGLVVDRDGNRIMPDGTVVDDDGNEIGREGIWDGYIVIPLPGGEEGALAKMVGADSVRVGKNSANVVFQGDPWFLPGPGPIVAVPTNEIVVNMFPEAYGEEGEENPILKYILPLGPTHDDLADQLMPTWAQGARQALAGVGVGTHSRVDQVWALQWQEQVNRERLGQEPELTYDERVKKVNNTTRNWTLLRLMGTQMPMVWSPQSRLQHYRNEWQRFLREDPQTAEERFEETYPEYFEMTMSLSANETGLHATDETWESTRRYQNEIKRNPQWGWFWAGAENLGGGFSQGVYAAQMREGQRRRMDPVEATSKAAAEHGWREYHKVQAMIDEEMERHGWSSLETIAARPLKELRNQYIEGLKQGNQDWAQEYEASGRPQSVTSFLTFALTALDDHPELNERGDMQAMVGYVEVREMLRDEMRRRRVAEAEARGQHPAPGTGSIESHPDLLAIWNEYTSGLVRSDLGFEQMWTRVLERDDLSGATYERSGS